jgi:hypothetical protein
VSRKALIAEAEPAEVDVHALGATAETLDAVPGCEGLRVDLDDLWTTVDRLTSE